MSPSFPSSPLPALLALPPAERARLRPSLERVHLDLKQVLYEPGQRITYVYFPIDSLVSLLTVLGDGQAIETGLAGREGMAGLSVFLGARVADRRAVCQVDGDAWRLPAAAFVRALATDGALPTLAARLSHYTHAVLREAAQAAACNRAHPVEERCARWLLLVADRIGRDQFPMTQQFMADMLGVRRASVVLVLGTLARAGLIENGYGTVAIVDRAGLEAAACECFAALRAASAPAHRQPARQRAKDIGEARRLGSRAPGSRRDGPTGA